MADVDKIRIAIDAALDAYMTTLFATIAHQIGGGHINEARIAARKGLQVARDTHSELTAIASEG